MRQGAIIVAHGQPSDPAPAEAALAALARRVAGHLPDGWRVASATLAMPDALERALAAAPEALIYPLFMADGWFTQVNLPGRLERAGIGAARARILPPMGCDPALWDLAVRAAEEGAQAHGLAPGGCDLILAAHGARNNAEVARAARRIAAHMAARGGFRAVRPGFVEEAPFLPDVARAAAAPALCLPLFAAGGEHVRADVPALLREGGFEGEILPAIGLHVDVPGLIAAALARGGMAGAAAEGGGEAAGKATGETAGKAARETVAGGEARA